MNCPLVCPNSGKNSTTAYYYGCRCETCKAAVNTHKNLKRRRDGRIAHTIRHARVRARKRGVPCTVENKDLPPIPIHCPALGISLVPQERRPGPNSPSLDCIDPLLGYVPGNLQWLSYKANVMKHNATPQELKKFATWVLQSS